MLRRVINPFLLLPLSLSMNTFNVLSSETKNYIDSVLEEKSNITFVDYQEIEKLVLNNQELKSLQNLVASASFNLSSKIAKTNYKIAENNYEIKKKDLIQEARIRYHKYKKSYRDIQNKQFTLDLSITSLKNAKAKLDAGIGTKFEVLEAEAQLSRDQQSLNE